MPVKDKFLAFGKKSLIWLRAAISRIHTSDYRFWLGFWFGGLLLTWFWNLAFLNAPALRQVEQGFFNTLLISLLVSIFVALTGWAVTNLIVWLETRAWHTAVLAVEFILNLLRALPQIVGLLLGYVLLTYLMQIRAVQSTAAVMTFMALLLTLMILPEIVDLLRERISYYRRSDFVNAMRVCGISEFRIINIEILWRNSLLHLMNKLIAVFAMAVFLQCSIDFILSVGLSTEVSGVNFPVTLGSMLAKIDSKQDILAIGHSLSNPSYFSRIFFEHLQGVTVAFLIVFTLFSLHRTGERFSKHYQL
jgi:hypothetical protein